ncbi:MAG: hypothetical protein V3W00_00510 [Candidatus Brocadiales bacterium]
MTSHGSIPSRTYYHPAGKPAKRTVRGTNCTKSVNLILAAFLICLNLTAAGCAVAIGARAGEKIHEELEKKDDKGDSGKEEQGEYKTGAGSDEAKPGGGK